MPLSPGEVFGPYEILAQIGAGGMGEVYRARDVRLEREVAIKVLPSAVAQDRERLARFEREAKVLASLNHPNIAHIYGLEQSGNTRALAMELVPGSTLLAPQPIEIALTYALQIAEALEVAHEKGITHRDLKPANIMITPGGIVKLLDFGLAAVPGRDAAASELAADSPNSPTLTMAATQAGVILGTAAYMSPEQAAGKVVDLRSDIWSFGVVLYEILTGERLFAGETVSHTLADVLRADIPFNRLPPSVPAPIRDLLERCLDRDIKMRLQSISEARIAIQKYLKDPSARASKMAGETPSRAHWWLWPSISVALAALFLSGTLMYIHRQAEESGPVRLSFTAPSEASFNDVRSDEIVISPDGRSIAFTARDRNGRNLLWVRTLESAEAKPLPGTDDPLWPFWSPDSRSLGLGSHGKLKRVDLAGGPTLELCDAPRLTGGTWNNEGTILFGADYNSALQRIPSIGGTPAPASVRDPGSEGGHWNPSFLPDGKHFLFRNKGAVAVGVLGSMQAKPLLNGMMDAQFAPPNWLLFVSRGALLAQHFDPDRQELNGEPLTVFSVPVDVREGPGTGHIFSVSTNGVLVWRGSWSHAYQLVWRDRTGKQMGVEGPVVKQTSDGQEPRLSPDGKRVAFKRDNAIWVTDVARYVPLRLSNGQVPIWSPDGHQVALASGALFVMAANGVGDSQKLADGVSIPSDWSPDGRFLLFFRRSEKTRNDIWVLPMFGDRSAYSLINSPADDVLARFSPDGGWIAYASDESGTDEVYVRSFTPDGRTGADHERVSSSGGTQPIWRRDGKELFYLSPKGEIMSVAVKRSGTGHEFGSPAALFTIVTPSSGRVLGTYDVAPDGQRFLIGELLGESGNATPSVILNWPRILAR
jgi:serine/threonine protein kinase